MQKTLILGRLGNDPEVKYLDNGKCLVNISVATSQRWKDKLTNEQKESTEWHRCTCFGKQAEVIGQHMVKGSQIYIEGENRTRKYEKEGQTHYATEVHIRQFEFVGPKPDGSQAKSAPTPPDDFDDDIPF